MARSKAMVAGAALAAVLLAAAVSAQAGALQDTYSPALQDIDVPPVTRLRSCKQA